MNCPPISPDLIHWLQSTWPVRPPKLTEDERSIWAEVGRQEIIQRLELEMNRQDKEEE